MKNNKNGITLIALVITIIVLLILAGISISLVTGQNGVLTRAEDASNTYSMASAKEQANMRAAGYVSEYMEKVYVDNDLSIGAMTTGEYVLSQINGEEDGDYRYSVSGSTITVTSKTTGEALASGTIGDDGGIAWSDTVASGGNSGNNNNNTTNTQIIKSVSEITTADYGQYVDLETSILPKTGDIITKKLKDNQQPLSDWRIFCKETNGVWLILADFMPNSSFDVSTVELVASTGDHATYGVHSDTSRIALLEGLNNSNWSNLIAGSSVDGKTGVVVKGAVDLITWRDSWNGNGYKHLNSRLTETPMDDGLYGNYIYGDNESETKLYMELGTVNGFNNTLYFPNGQSVSGCGAYWLASPCAGNSSAAIMYISYNGGLRAWYYDGAADYGYPSDFGVRPAVYLPSNINLETSGSVWTVVD